jgi:hypothetical protein
LHVQIAVARHRILDEFAWPDRPADEVNAAFDNELRRLVNARVQTFLPLLVERAVRQLFAADSLPAPRTCGYRFDDAGSV